MCGHRWRVQGSLPHRQHAPPPQPSQRRPYSGDRHQHHDDELNWSIHSPGWRRALTDWLIYWLLDRCRWSTAAVALEWLCKLASAVVMCTVQYPIPTMMHSTLLTCMLKTCTCSWWVINLAGGLSVHRTDWVSFCKISTGLMHKSKSSCPINHSHCLHLRSRDILWISA